MVGILSLHHLCRIPRTPEPFTEAFWGCGGRGINVLRIESVPIQSHPYPALTFECRGLPGDIRYSGSWPGLEEIAERTSLHGNKRSDSRLLFSGRFTPVSDLSRELGYIMESSGTFPICPDSQSAAENGLPNMANGSDAMLGCGFCGQGPLTAGDVFRPLAKSSCGMGLCNLDGLECGIFRELMALQIMHEKPQRVAAHF